MTGTHFRSGYELYAHVIVAEGRGLSDEKLDTIVAGQPPSDLTREEEIAYDMAAALVSGGTLSAVRCADFQEGAGAQLAMYPDASHGVAITARGGLSGACSDVPERVSHRGARPLSESRAAAQCQLPAERRYPD